MEMEDFANFRSIGGIYIIMGRDGEKFRRCFMWRYFNTVQGQVSWVWIEVVAQGSLRRKIWFVFSIQGIQKLLWILVLGYKKVELTGGLVEVQGQYKEEGIW